MSRFTSSMGVLAAAALIAGCGEEVVAPTSPNVAESLAHVPVAAATGGRFIAPLSADEEVPVPDLTATKNPRGMATFQVGSEGDELAYRLIVANIENVTQAHIHCGAAGVSGPVVAFLFGFVDGGVSVDGVLAEGTVTDMDIIARPDSEVCPGGVANFDEMVAHMRDGTAYVNVHTVQNPPGEIRGQIRATGHH
jgi:hypothetical protein